MSAPIAKSQMAFELPKLSYIDTSWEEPAVNPAADTVRAGGIVAWIAARASDVRTWRAKSQSRAELAQLTDRELADVGLNRGDLDRMFDDRFNWDLRERAPLSF